jgi:hypothetical protein
MGVGIIMNYIRTENKIIKVRRNKWNELVDKQGKYIAELEIINQADTIEELCDEFVMVWNKKKFPYSTSRQYLSFAGYGDLKRDMREEENFGFYLNQDYIIYGAIWTPKGLIYVAKMNSDGALELI